jgi:hypothetical protein
VSFVKPPLAGRQLDFDSAPSCPMIPISLNHAGEDFGKPSSHLEAGRFRGCQNHPGLCHVHRDECSDLANTRKNMDMLNNWDDETLASACEDDEDCEPRDSVLGDE